MIPGVAQVADARDTIAAVNAVRLGVAGVGIGLAAAIIGWISVGGDAAKAALCDKRSSSR